jgi:hypothetical protein
VRPEPAQSSPASLKSAQSPPHKRSPAHRLHLAHHLVRARVRRRRARRRVARVAQADAGAVVGQHGKAAGRQQLVQARHRDQRGAQAVGHDHGVGPRPVARRPAHGQAVAAAGGARRRDAQQAHGRAGRRRVDDAGEQLFVAARRQPVRQGAGARQRRDQPDGQQRQRHRQEQRQQHQRRERLDGLGEGEGEATPRRVRDAPRRALWAQTVQVAVSGRACHANVSFRPTFVAAAHTAAAPPPCRGATAGIAVPVGSS